MPEHSKQPDPERYHVIDERNDNSWYMQDSDRPFMVNMSFQTLGSERTMYNKFNDSDDIVQAGRAANRLIRFSGAGNMSTAMAGGSAAYGPDDFSSDERILDARKNMEKHLANLNIDPASVRVLNPDRDYTTPLVVVNIDADSTEYDGTEPAKLHGQGDMVYTYNPNIVLGVRPADCPLVVLSADTPKGRIFTMTHFAWQGAAAQQVKDMERELSNLGVDLSTASVYITPGGQAETFPFENLDQHPDEKYPDVDGMFYRVESHDDKGKEKYNFQIDTPNFVYEGILKMGIDPQQVFVDTSDTTSPASGYASHSRSVRLADNNGRDLVTVKLEAGPSRVASNPNLPTPPEIEWQIIPVEVEYYDFEGTLQKGEIEVNREVYEDVKDFFALAKELKFPIERVVKSSDPNYKWDDTKLMASNASSGFNYRLINDGTGRPSLHGRGLAFDVNTRLNPYVKYSKEDDTFKIDPDGATYDPNQPGTLTSDHPLVTLLKDRGWEWGGDWERDDTPDAPSRTDYQHFQKPIN